MRWQRILRFVIALAGLGFAWLLYSRYDHKGTTQQAAVPPPMEPGATYQSAMSPGRDSIRYKNNVEVGRWSYAMMRQFADGRRVVDKIRYTSDRDGKPFTVSADRAEMNAPAPGAKVDDIAEETHLIGNVVMKEQDGMEIKTDDAVYHESSGMLDVPGAMTFADTRTSGEGVGATYDRNQQLLTLKEQARVHMAPDQDGQGKFDAEARAMLINRNTHFASLDGDARLTRAHEVMSADSIQMHLNDDNHGIQLMELHARSRIMPIGGAGAAPEMHADDINLEFQPDGRTIKHSNLLRKASMVISGQSGKKQIAGDLLDVQLGADGQTVTRLTGNGGPLVLSLPATRYTPERKVSGRQLETTGDDKNGLTGATLKQDVSFIENRPADKGKAAGQRKVTSAQLVLTLNAGDLADIQEARFGTNVKFEDGTTAGSAEDVKYIAAEGKLILRSPSSAKRSPSVKTERISVDAWIIDIDLDKTIITASESLQTRTVPDKTKANKGLFDESKQTNGIADSLRYEGDQHLAMYSGKVNLWQQGKGADETRIVAGAVSIDDTKGDIHADGKVTTKFRIDSMQGTATQAPTTATAAKFDYTDADHKARYTGTASEPALLNSSDGKIYGGLIDLWLTDDGHDLKRMLATTNVVARVSGDRTVRTDRMDYDVKTGLYMLSGKRPSRVITRELDKGVESCSVTVAPEMTFTKVTDSKQPAFTIPNESRAGSSTDKAKNCDEWRIK